MGEKLESLTCKTCGGQLIRQSAGTYRCANCKLVWERSDAGSEEQILLAQAYGLLQNGRVEDAEEAMARIAEKFPKSHEAYYGRLLAKNGVEYVEDLSENKRVPTCHSERFAKLIGDPLLDKAVSLAPKEVGESYRRSAEQMERLHAVWREKASKLKAYDVFLCFKDSDKEHGIARTKDSETAQELYQYLTEKGLRCFFSRISLRDVVGEEYEPYIFEALKCAGAMVVYASKAEYFDSRWMRNEWTRFAEKLRAGAKAEGSLIVLNEGVPPEDLPAGLRRLQYIDGTQRAAFEQVYNAALHAVEQNRKPVQLGKVNIQTGRVGGKAKTVAGNKIEVKEFTEKNPLTLTPGTETNLTMADSNRKTGLFGQAQKLYDRVLAENPGNAPARLGSFLAERKKTDIEAYADGLSDGADSENGITELKGILERADEDTATSILTGLQRTAERTAGFGGNADPTRAPLVETVLSLCAPYNYAGRNKLILDTLTYAETTALCGLFEKALSALGSGDPDVHIRHLTNLTDRLIGLQRWEEAGRYNGEVLALENGNRRALWNRILLSVHSPDMMKGNSVERLQDFTALDEFLSYCSDGSASDDTLIKLIGAAADCGESGRVFEQLYSRLSEEPNRKAALQTFADAALAAHNYEKAAKYYGLRAAENDKDQRARLGLLLCALRVTAEADIPDSDVPIGDLPELTDLIVASGNDTSLVQKMTCLAKKQDDILKEKAVERYKEEQEERERLRRKQKADVTAKVILSFKILGTVLFWAFAAVTAYLNYTKYGSVLYLVHTLLLTVPLAIWYTIVFFADGGGTRVLCWFYLAIIVASFIMCLIESSINITNAWSIVIQIYVHIGLAVFQARLNYRYFECDIINPIVAIIPYTVVAVAMPVLLFVFGF